MHLHAAGWQMSKSSVLFKPFKHLTIRQKRRGKGKLFNLWEDAALSVTGKILLQFFMLNVGRKHSVSVSRARRLSTLIPLPAHIKYWCTPAAARCCCAKIRESRGCTVEAAQHSGQFLMEELRLILEMFWIFLFLLIHLEEEPNWQVIQLYCNKIQVFPM